MTAGMLLLTALALGVATTDRGAGAAAATAGDAPVLALIAEDLEIAGRLQQALSPRYPEIRLLSTLESAQSAAATAGGPTLALMVRATPRPGTTQLQGATLTTCHVLATTSILRLPAGNLEATRSVEANAPTCEAALDQAAATLGDELIVDLARLERERPEAPGERDQLWVELPDDWRPEERQRLVGALGGLAGVLELAEEQDEHFLELAVFRQPEAIARAIDRLEGVRVAQFRGGRRIVVRPESATSLRVPGAKEPSLGAESSAADELGDPRRWALVVGVSTFADGEIPTLSYPVKDALAFRDVLIDSARFPADQVKLLTDDRATTRRIKMELDYLARLTRPEDLFLFFISTHAVSGSFDTAGDAYLITHDTESEHLYPTGFPMRELVNALSRRIRAETVVGFLDACHTGQILDGSEGEFPRRVLPEEAEEVDPSRRVVSWSAQWEELQGKSIASSPALTPSDAPAEAKRIVIISSSDGHQPSWESEKLGHGVFTYHLMNGLRRNRGRILLSDLFDYLKEAVNRSVLEEMGRFQEPKMFVSKTADFWIVGDSG